MTDSSSDFAPGQEVEHGQFRRAVALFDAGDAAGLAALLDSRPVLVHYRCRHGEWYESGYFAGATLIEHVAGNPDRGPLPGNVVDLARLILARRPDGAALERTIGLLLTSRRASEAAVALVLIDLLAAAGAPFDAGAADLLTLPLLNAAPATAAALAVRGAPMELRHAAGLGDLAAMERWLRPTASIGAAPAASIGAAPAASIGEAPSALGGAGAASAISPVTGSPPLAAAVEAALVFACVRGQAAAAERLVQHGAQGDVLVAPGGRTPRTALHEAANRGHREIVELLLAAGADPSVVEPHWGGTAAGWAAEGGHQDIAGRLRGAVRQPRGGVER